MTEYTHRHIGANMYVINTDLDGDLSQFRVVVAKDESELDGLVEHHIATLTARPTIPPISAAVAPTIGDLEAKLSALATQIAALKSTSAN